MICAQRVQGGQFRGLDGSSAPFQFAVMVSLALTVSSVGASGWPSADSELALGFDIVEGCLEYRGLLQGVCYPKLVRAVLIHGNLQTVVVAPGRRRRFILVEDGRCSTHRPSFRRPPRPAGPPRKKGTRPLPVLDDSVFGSSMSRAQSPPMSAFTGAARAQGHVGPGASGPSSWPSRCPRRDRGTSFS